MGGLAIGHNAPAPSGIITHAEACPAWELLRLVGHRAAAGFTLTAERNEAMLRVDYLWLPGQAYGLRSSRA